MQSGRGQALLIYGASGTGKTSCLRNLPPEKGIILTTEPEGLEALQRFGWDSGNFFVVEQPKTLGELLLKLSQEKYEWVALDTLSGYYDLLWEEYMQENKLAPDDVSFTPYRYCLNILQSVIIRFMTLVDNGVHVILLCHQKELTEQGPGYSSNATAPGLTGQLPERVCKRMSMVLRANKVEREGKTTYVLSNPSGANVGKDLTGKIKGPIENDIVPLLTRAPAAPKPKPEKKQEGSVVSQAKPKDLPKPEEEKEEKTRLKVLPSNGGKIDTSQVKYLLELAVEADMETKELLHYVKTKYNAQLRDLTEEQLGEMTVYLTTIVDQRRSDAEEVF